jgi:quinolinate synthase
MTERSHFAVREINRLREEKHAIILAHYYQEEAIQDIADFVGDSLELARKAAQTDSRIIVFAGVYFMAETAKILNPGKKVLLPDLLAGCSLADGCPPGEFSEFKAGYPDHQVVTYINTSAAIKAMSDYVCTSSNAEKIIRSISEDQPLIFAPDRNLGAYLNKVTGREMVLWDGSCIVHEAFSLEKLTDLMLKYPEAKIVAHPESEEAVLRIAHEIGSTSQMRKFINSSSADTFIVATEAGILHQLSKEVPDKKLIPAPSKEDNSCACSECAFMKVNTLEKVYHCLRDETPEVQVDSTLASKAVKPIERMLEMS